MQPVMPWSSHLHCDLSKGNRSLNVLGNITKRILLAKIAGDSCRYAGDRFGFLWEVGDATGIPAEPPEKTGVFFSVASTKEANGIDQGLRLARLN
jgi:hypothetical protein